MKELEKTKRISISAVLFLLVILISILTYRKPEFSFVNNPEKTLAIISNQAHVISLKDFNSLSGSTYQLIDVRNNIDYSKGHISSAINIPLSQLLVSINKQEIETETKESLIIVYGESPENASAAWITLYQLGYEQVKLLSVDTFYKDHKFHINNVNTGASNFDYAQKMKEASTQKIKKIQPKPKVETSKKKVTPKPKKKKKMPEGGC